MKSLLEALKLIKQETDDDKQRKLQSCQGIIKRKYNTIKTIVKELL